MDRTVSVFIVSRQGIPTVPAGCCVDRMEFVSISTAGTNSFNCPSWAGCAPLPVGSPVLGSVEGDRSRVRDRRVVGDLAEVECPVTSRRRDPAVPGEVTSEDDTLGGVLAGAFGGEV